MTFEEQDYNLSFFNRIRTNFILNKESIDKIAIIFSKNFRQYLEIWMIRELISTEFLKNKEIFVSTLLMKI